MGLMAHLQEPNPENLTQINQVFYERMWEQTTFYGPEHFNTWDVLSKLCENAPRRLEVGPGLRPRLPLNNTVFVDLSAAACARLQTKGATAQVGSLESLNFPENSFDLICVFDVIEHISDDHKVFSRLSQLLVDEGTLFFSVPLHPEAWTAFDTVVGHFRRYVPTDLQALLQTYGFEIQRSAVFGMQPRSKILQKLSSWWLTNHFEMAMSYHNRFFFPLGLKLQKTLQFHEGFLCDSDIDEVLLICRRQARDSGQQDNIRVACDQE